MQYILNQEEYEEYMALKNKGEAVDAVEVAYEKKLYEDLMRCLRFETIQFVSFPSKTFAVFSIDPDETSDIMKEIVRHKASKIGARL